MPDIREYYRKVRAEAAKLDPEAAALDAAELEPGDRRYLRESRKEVWIRSTETMIDSGGRAGKMSPVYPYLAAQYVVNRTHRLATAEEIAEELKQNDASRERQVAEDRARQNASILRFDPMLIGAILEGQK